MDGFFRRSALTTAWVAPILALGLWARLGGAAAVSFALGAVVGALFVAAIVVVVEGTIRVPEERPKRRWPYVVAYVGKFLVAAGVMYLVMRWRAGSLLIFTAGFGLPIAVMVLKALGTALNERLGIKGPEE